MKIMKYKQQVITITAILLIGIFVGFLSNPLQAQQSFRTLNPKLNPGVAPMVNINLQQLFGINGSTLTAGIIGQINGIGEIRIKVYRYDATLSTGIGTLMFEQFIQQSSSSFSGTGVQYNRSSLGEFAEYFPDLWDSADIRTAAFAIDRKKYHELVALNGMYPFVQKSIPVIIEITESANATLSKFKIPGIGEFDYDDLIVYQDKLSNLLKRTGTRFAMIGDYGWDGPDERTVSNLVKSWNPNFIVSHGDDSYADKLNNKLDDNVGKYYQDYIYPYTGDYGTGSPTNANRFFPVLGNHDYKIIPGQPTDYLLNQWLNYFTLPSTGTNNNERYYDYVMGDVHFFALNWNPQEPYGRESTSVQGQWLKNKLAASNSKFKIVYGHQTPYSSGFTDRPGHGSLEVLQWPFKEWGADLVISGHEHIYERLIVDGMTFLVNGVGGAPLYGFIVLNQNYVAHIEGKFGAVLGEVVGNTLKFKFITTDFRIRDEFEIVYSAGLSPAAANSESASKIIQTDYRNNKGLLIYPNPNNGIITVEFDLDRASPVKMDIFTIFGQKVKSLQYELPKGANTITIEDFTLPTGSYTLHITTKEFKKTKKFIVAE